MPVVVRQAAIHDVANIAPLFDAYRQFYGKASDLELARTFLSDRIRLQESVVFLATNVSCVALGFTQLYPAFSSTRAAKTYILNDLFVSPEARRTGIARSLLKAATQFGSTAGAVKLSLSTATTNTAAQKLYESLGWKKDETFCEYGFIL